MDDENQSKGPFDRILRSDPIQQRDRTAVLVVTGLAILGVILLILVLPPVSIFDDGESGRPTTPATQLQEELPALPEGFEAVSGLLDLSDQAAGPPLTSALVTVPLTASADEGERLPVYTYGDGEWQRLGEAVVLAGGFSARAELTVLPANIAVLRQRTSAQMVLGSLPAGAQPDPSALESVTAVNARGFTPGADGSVVGDRGLLSGLAGSSVAPTIGVFLPAEIEALDAILASPETNVAHVNAVLAFAAETGAAGIDLDYRAVAPERSEAFTALVQSLAEGLHEDGRTLTITLPPPVRSGETWDTRGFAWEALVPLVDGVKIAPPTDPASYFTVMEDALQYLVPRVGGNKLLLTIGPLSREQSVDGVRTLSLNNALALASVPATRAQPSVGPESTVELFGQNLAASTGASGLHWDGEARAVVFSYAGAGGERTVWLANAFSEASKLDLAARHRLGGVAVESIGAGAASANIWPIVRQFVAGEELTLLAPNGALLEPRWSASGGELESDAGAEVVWSAPAEPGSYTVTLIVSDGAVRVGQQLSLSVGTAAAAP